MTFNQDLADRLRAILGELGPFTEKKMFGGLCFLKDGKMVFAANHTGDLMVRVEAARAEEYLERGAQRAMMGKGNPMSPNWLVVPVESVADPEELRYWTGVALAFHATLS